MAKIEDYYWTLDNWGDAFPPENAEEICNEANSLLDAYVEQSNIDLDNWDDECDLHEYCAGLWETYCCTGKLIA